MAAIRRWGAIGVVVLAVVFGIWSLIGYSWMRHTEESGPDYSELGQPSLPPPTPVTPEVVAPLPAQPASIAAPSTIDETRQTLPTAVPLRPDKAARISKAEIKKLLPRARPKVWQVPEAGNLGIQEEARLVWCAEEYIGRDDRCGWPLIDMMSGERQRKVKIPSEEFEITAVGITHLPSATRFIAYPFVQRFGFFSDGQYGIIVSNGKKYDRDDVQQAMKSLWRKRMDELDPNRPISPG
jgi:hypothetical protein